MTSPPPPPKSAGVSPAVLVLSVLLAAATTAAVVLALRPAVAPGGGDAPAKGGTEPEVQKDTVSPRDKVTGQVFYPIPFATPPHLKLGATKRGYDITKQDEMGFTWLARLTADDFDPEERLKRGGGLEKMDAAAFLRMAVTNQDPSLLKKGLVFEEFTWEARGVRGGGPARLEQTGTFTVLPNTEGEVIFPVPYAQPASVELSGNSFTIVTECRANGFKWKNACEKGKEFFAQGSVGYKARGVRQAPK